MNNDLILCVPVVNILINMYPKYQDGEHNNSATAVGSYATKFSFFKNIQKSPIFREALEWRIFSVGI